MQDQMNLGYKIRSLALKQCSEMKDFSLEQS